jgi:DNA-binding SARP family transcriptional activator
VSAVADGSEERSGVEVLVLGPVEIVGAARPFARAWAVELIVYLAMHRNGASSEQWATALWPDRIMAAASLHSTASAARRSLGVSISGEDHLPRAHGRLTLAASVKSDWNRFVELSERAEPENWHRALDLIRGRPFEGLRAPDWVLLEGIAATIEATVVDLASRYAEHCLSAGDPGRAEWSARQGLQVSAYDERLYRLLLRAADAAGNPAGVESVMTELVRLVADDVEPYDAVHPETLELYRTLSRRSTPSPIR